MRRRYSATLRLEPPAHPSSERVEHCWPLLRLAWEWDPQARCSAAALALNLGDLDTVRRTSNPLISEMHGIHAVTIGDAGRKLQIKTGEINLSTSISISTVSEIKNQHAADGLIQL